MSLIGNLLEQEMSVTGEPSALPCGDERSVRIVDGNRRGVVEEAGGARGEVKKTSGLGGREEGRVGRVEKSVLVEVGDGGKKTVNLGGGRELRRKGGGGGKEGRKVVAGGKRSREAREGKTSLVRKVVVEKGSVKEVMEGVDISSPGALVDNSGQGSLVDISGHEALVEAVRRHGEKVDTLRRRGRVR